MSKRPMIESLESRTLFASAVLYTTGTATGELLIHGSANARNNISIELINSLTQFRVIYDGKTKLFPRAQVNSVYLIGGDRADTLTVIDKSHGFTFPVHIFGRGGNDTLTGGSGNDTISGENGDDLIQGGLGNDLLSGDAGNDRIYGGFVNPVFGDGNDTLFGGTGNDLMVGGGNYDLMFGEDGNDTMYGGVANDPTNQFGDASDDMFAGNGNDVMYAGFGRNRMHGQAGNDTLVGGPDNDTLYGGLGHNDVIGGGGHDLGAAQAEWQFLPRLLAKITPLKPVDPGF
ncbi:MAG TPA: calcium-binding protein [Tepidisphaeraceae bacterium]|jgi:Ca2+-binding RTX toxin-like protein|nr:calcium-binding protein [Tepidisphaeraceae bacterium]